MAIKYFTVLYKLIGLALRRIEMTGSFLSIAPFMNLKTITDSLYPINGKDKLKVKLM